MKSQTSNLIYASELLQQMQLCSTCPQGRCFASRWGLRLFMIAKSEYRVFCWALLSRTGIEGRHAHANDIHSLQGS